MSPQFTCIQLILICICRFQRMKQVGSNTLSVPLTISSPVNSRTIFYRPFPIPCPYLQSLQFFSFLWFSSSYKIHLSLPFSLKLSNTPLVFFHPHSHTCPLQSGFYHTHSPCHPVHTLKFLLPSFSLLSFFPRTFDLSISSVVSTAVKVTGF